MLSTDFIIELHSLILPTKKNLSSEKKISVFDKKWKYYPKFINTETIFDTLTYLIDLHNSSISKNENLIHIACKFILCLLEIHPFADGNGRLAKLLIAYILYKPYKQWITFSYSQKKFIRCLNSDRESLFYSKNQIYTHGIDINNFEQGVNFINYFYHKSCSSLISLLQTIIFNETILEINLSDNN